MGPMMMAALIVAATAITNLSFDVGLNELQNWGGTVYADAFWTPRERPSAAMRALAREEADIDRQLAAQDFMPVDPAPAEPPH